MAWVLSTDTYTSHTTAMGKLLSCYLLTLSTIGPHSGFRRANEHVSAAVRFVMQVKAGMAPAGGGCTPKDGASST